jgi:hypothetical protein
VPYQDEDDINSQLRHLTIATRKLRQELNALVRSGESKDLTRGLLHITGKVKLDPPAAADEPREKSRTKKR